MTEIGFGRSTLVWAQVINMSLSGMLCRTVPELGPQSSVSISMILPDGTRIDCEGIAVRTEEVEGEHRVGIAFTDFEGGGREALARFVFDPEGSKPSPERR